MNSFADVLGFAFVGAPTVSVNTFTVDVDRWPDARGRRSDALSMTPVVPAAFATSRLALTSVFSNSAAADVIDAQLRSRRQST